MHSMPKSAIPMSRREQSARKISRAAQALTAEKGFEGFTMEDLAEAAGVSRRTLFNYFDSKLDAVLGPEPDLDAQITAEFRSGGPTGRLLEDLGTLAHDHFARIPHERRELATMREVIRNPRILSACHARFEALAERILAMIREREGARADELAARVALGTLVMLCQVALDNFITTADERSFIDHYDAAVEAARSLFG